MTIAEALAQADKLKPNRYERAQKADWLAEIEGLIYREVIQTHENPMRIREPHIDNNTDPDMVLIAGFPYCSLYVYYLKSQIALNNMEIGDYNNNKTLFDNSYMTFRDYWNRTYMPVEKAHALRFDEAFHIRPYDGHPLMSSGDPLDNPKRIHPVEFHHAPQPFEPDPLHGIVNDIRKINRTDANQESEISALQGGKLDSDAALTATEIGVILDE